MADFCLVNPCVIANLRPLSDHACTGNAGVAGDNRPGKGDGILIVNPAITVLRQHAFVVNPAAWRTGLHIIKVGEGDDLV
ncbi:hypothetical protein D3C73_1012270 [compost metagenome]